jgi:hypothetical protein
MIKKLLKRTFLFDHLKVAFYFFKRNFRRRKISKKLHLGCGNEYLEDYINVDISISSKADIVCNISDVEKSLNGLNFDEILMVHSISYLRHWEVNDFIETCLRILNTNGKLIIELPDLSKCAKVISNADIIDFNYLEALRAIFAYDVNEHKSKKKYHTYKSGWSSLHLCHELSKAGFKDVRILDPLFHDSQTWRDVRIEAIK